MNIVDNNDAYTNLDISSKYSPIKEDLIKAHPETKQQLKEVCRQFESIFLYFLLEKMRDTVPKEGFFEQGVSYDIIQSMHDEALAEELSKNGSVGLADQLYDQLSKYV